MLLDYLTNVVDKLIFKYQPLTFCKCKLKSGQLLHPRFKALLTRTLNDRYLHFSCIIQTEKCCQKCSRCEFKRNVYCKNVK